MNREAIFQGEDGRQIKFFIQKDLDVDAVEKLHYHISENGGRVETKVPIQGFVLIDPRSPEGGRLTDCWETSERPLRNFVPYTFVAACLEARRLIPQVFRKNGVALKFHIHPCITSEQVIESLRNHIWHSGGQPLATETEADIIIADEELPSFRSLIDRFDHFHTKYVEGISWIKQCVESGVYENTPVTKKNLGGRIPGNKRTEFTPEDDSYLAMYIACRLPDSGMRGRTGNKLYLDLCSRLDLYPWAERHPWQSWRERYKNNSARFSKLIASYLDQHPVPESGKGLHGFVRVSSSSKSQSKQPNVVQSESLSKEGIQGPCIGNVDDTDEEWGSQWSIKVGRKSPPSLGKGKRKADHDKPEETMKRHKIQSDHNNEHGNHPTRRLLQGLLNREKSHQISPKFGTGCVIVDGINARRNAVQFSETPKAQRGSPTHNDGADKTYNNEANKTQKDEANKADNDDTNTAHDDDANTVHNGYENKALDDNSQDDGVGLETQGLLDANRAILTESISPQLPPSIPLLEDERPREPGTAELPVQPNPAVADPIDADVKLALVGVACGCRFLLDEVMEEYEELNRNLDATRSYFKDIRALINERKSMRGKQG